MWGLQQCTECHEGREGLASQQGQRRRNRWIRISGGRRIPRSLDGRRGAHDDRRQLETSNAGDFKICRQMFPLSLKGESAVDVESCFRRGRDLSEMTASLQPHPIYAVWPHLWHAPPIFSFFFFPFLAIGVPFMQSYSWKLFCSVCTCVRIPNTPYSLMPSALVLTRCSLFMQQFILLIQMAWGLHSGADPISISGNACLNEAKPLLSTPRTRLVNSCWLGLTENPSCSALPTSLRLILPLLYFEVI
jgi:hypothetical protein